MSSPKIGGPNDHDPYDYYCERIAQECIQHKDDIRRIILKDAQTPDHVDEAVDMAISSVMQYAMQHGSERKIENVKAFLLTSARHKLKDIQSRKLAADKLETVSWDDEQNAGLLNQAVDSSAKDIQTRMAIDEWMTRDATKEQTLLFKMFHEDGLDTKEIAAHFNISEVTARHRIKKLNAILQAALRGQVGRQ
jgi:RNA polymerase sigma factor (sigma-70 family)